MEGKIEDIIIVALDKILLELFFNIEYQNARSSFHLGINDDGETVFFNYSNTWVTLNSINYNAYTLTRVVETTNDELANLLRNKISNIQFGIGQNLDDGSDVIYYIKIDTDKNVFLFFNNGDQGKYSFNQIEKILANDIYTFQWRKNLPSKGF